MSINETEFLQTLFTKIPLNKSVLIPPGDDCAGIEQHNDEISLLTVDQLSEGVHYSSSDFPKKHCPSVLGSKLLKRSISDIAAMAGNPKYALVTHCLNAQTSQNWLENFTDGILETAKHFQITLIGGDICCGASNVSSLTLTGIVEKEKVCLRSNAASEESIFVTGTFGGSLLTDKHLFFTPRLQEAQWVSNHAFSSCMIDVTDGLLIDLHRICCASRVSAVLSESSIPKAKISEVPVSLSSAFLDGEDYEIIFSVPSKKKTDLLTQWPFSTKITEIGSFQRLKGLPTIANREGEDLLSKYPETFNHFLSKNCL